MTYLPPDPLEIENNEKYNHIYRGLRRLRMVDPGLITTKLFFTSLLITTILYTIPALFLLLNNMPLKYTFVSAGSYVFLQMPIFYRYTKKDVSIGWLLTIPIIISVSFIAYNLYQYKYLTIFLFILSMCMPVILPKFLGTKGNVIGVSMMNAYLNAMLNAPLLQENPKYLYISHGAAIIAVLIIALTSYLVVTDPLRKMTAVRKSLRAIAQGFSQLYVSDSLDLEVKSRKAKKLSQHFHNCAISIDAVLNESPPLPEGIAQTYHRAVFDEEQALSTLADTISENLSYFEQRYYWNEFCKCRVIQNKLGKQIDEYIAEYTKFNVPKIRLNKNKNIVLKAKKNSNKISLSVDEFDITNNDTPQEKSIFSTNICENTIKNQHNINYENEENILEKKTNFQNFEMNVYYSDLKAIPAVVIADSAAKNNVFSKITLDLRTRNFIQGLVAISLASIVGYFINDKYFYFSSLGAYALLLGSSTTADKWRKMKKRVLGTVVGAVLGVVSYWAVTSIHLFPEEGRIHFLPIMVLLIIYISIGVSLIRVNYFYFVLFMTAMVVQMYIILHAPLYLLLFDRIIETAIGATIGVVVALIIFPVNSKKALNKGLNIFSVRLRKEIISLKQAWVNKIYDETITQLARETENIHEGLAELSAIMVKTPWSRESRNYIYKIISTVNRLVGYMNNSISHTMFIYELKGKLPDLTVEQSEAINEGLKVLDIGAQLLGLEITQRNKHIWPNYNDVITRLAQAFDDYEVLDSNISIVRSQTFNWHSEYFFAKDLAQALSAMHVLHARLLKN